MEGARRATGVPGIDNPKQVSGLTMPKIKTPNPEVPERAARRQYSAAYKLSILQQADACAESGGIAALLRREGLYSSHLTTWRRQRKEGTLTALKPKTRGRKPMQKNPLSPEVERLQKENKRLQSRLQQAELIIDVQKKVSAMLGVPLNGPERSGNE